MLRTKIHTTLMAGGLAVASFACLATAQDQKAKEPSAAAKSVYDFTVRSIDGKKVALSKYKGDVMLIVNVASKWGFTDRTYSGLESIHEKYSDQGLKILAFPANNFGKQEPGSNKKIKAFCRKEKNAKYDLFAKTSVKGSDQCPLYKFLTTYPDKKIAGEVKWNFEKYLVGRDGKVIARFGTRTLPQSEEVTAAIEKALAAEGA